MKMVVAKVDINFARKVSEFVRPTAFYIAVGEKKKETEKAIMIGNHWLPKSQIEKVWEIEATEAEASAAFAKLKRGVGRGFVRKLGLKQKTPGLIWPEDYFVWPKGQDYEDGDCVFIYF